MLRVQDIHKSYADTLVLRGVSFEVKPGEILGLVGPSGAGKSVLLKILGGVEKPNHGRVTFSTGSSSTEDIENSGVGFLFQEGALFDSLSVIENVAFPLLSGGAHRGDVSYDSAMSRAYEILGEVGLADAYLKYPGQLSGGMRRRVGIARALVSEPQLVLLDDPTGGLDPVAATVIMNLIRELHEHYQPTIVLVSHDIRRLLPNVQRLLALFDGKIVLDEAPANLQDQASEKVLKFLATRFDFNSNALTASRTGESQGTQ